MLGDALAVLALFSDKSERALLETSFSRTVITLRAGNKNITLLTGLAFFTLFSLYTSTTVCAWSSSAVDSVCGAPLSSTRPTIQPSSHSSASR